MSCVTGLMGKLKKIRQLPKARTGTAAGRRSPVVRVLTSASRCTRAVTARRRARSLKNQ